MHRYLVTVFYKQQPEHPTIDQLLRPENLQSGDRFIRVFKGNIEFLNGSDDNILDQLFATFNGHGQALPLNISIPRSMSVGDIIMRENAFAFLVTATGFERLPLTPDTESSNWAAFVIRQVNPSTLVIEEATKEEKVRNRPTL